MTTPIVKKPRKKRTYIEAAEQKFLIQQFQAWAQAEFPGLYEALVYTPNDELRDLRRGANAKKMGLIPGQPDLTLYAMRQGYGALLIEMKSFVGFPSIKQKKIIKDRQDAGYKVVVCQGWIKAWQEICDYLNIAEKWRVH